MKWETVYTTSWYHRKSPVYERTKLERDKWCSEESTHVFTSKEAPMQTLKSNSLFWLHDNYHIIQVRRIINASNEAVS